MKKRRNTQKKCKIKFVVLKPSLHEMSKLLESIVYNEPKNYALCIEFRALLISLLFMRRNQWGQKNRNYII
jgi:uncharacterized protein YdeI (YjbR/CyaY-like superfamily)